jgi:hypothetical protein
MTLSTSHEIAPSYESEMKKFANCGSDCLGDAF